MKIDKAAIGVSDEVPQEVLADFARGLHLSNYEYSLKTDTLIKDQEKKAKKDKKKDKEEKDPRDDKISKIVDIDSNLHFNKKLDVASEVEVAVKESQAVKEARTLCNTRATVCDPEYFAAKI